MIRLSITRRLLIISAVMLAAFLGIAAYALDRAYINASNTDLSQRLEAHAYTLLADAQDGPQGELSMPTQSSDPRFNQLDSGYQASIIELPKRVIWRSVSIQDEILTASADLKIGQTQLSIDDLSAHYEQVIAWEDFSNKEHIYSIVISMDIAPHLAEQASFRSTLWQWLSFTGLGLLITLIMAVRWGLRPLSEIPGHIQALEKGDVDMLSDDVASELKPLTQQINALLAQMHRRHERIRHAMSDMAHSLKTPLALMRSQLKADDTEVNQQIDEIDRMIRYYRQRATLAGTDQFGALCRPHHITQRIAQSLEKVHRGKSLRISVEIPEDLECRADEGDLYELFGNLLENAAKYAQQSVKVSYREGIWAVSDDGPGISAADAERVLQRGQRADEQRPGQGIGLAVVKAIVEQYDGQVEIGKSALDGAEIRFSLPAAEFN
jgi:two-component system sensor histidine kinase PhoQ